MKNRNTHPSPFKLKLEHQLEQRQEAEEFTIDANVKIIRQGSLLKNVFFSSTVDNFIFEDEDCPEKVELYELFIDTGIVEHEAQFLLIDMIVYVSRKTKSLDDDYKGILTLTVEVTLPPEPVDCNRAGSGKTQSQEAIATTTKMVEQRLRPNHKLQKTMYKIGADGMSLVRCKARITQGHKSS